MISRKGLNFNRFKSYFTNYNNIGISLIFQQPHKHSVIKHSYNETPLEHNFFYVTVMIDSSYIPTLFSKICHLRPPEPGGVVGVVGRVG